MFMGTHGITKSVKIIKTLYGWTGTCNKRTADVIVLIKLIKLVSWPHVLSWRGE